MFNVSKSQLVNVSKSPVLAASKSQVFSISKSQVRKVGSKELFEKATAAKHLRGELVNIGEGEVIGVLRGKLEEKGTTIDRLHSLIEDLNAQLAQLKAQLEQQSKGRV